MEQFWSAVIAAAFGVAATMATHWGVGRRWRKEREERGWAEALAMARVVESSEESELAKSIARSRLRTLGITEDWLSKSRKAEFSRSAAALFGPPRPDSEEIEAVSRALKSEPAELDPDLKRVATAMAHIDELFMRARADATAEEDTKVRIFVLLLLFSATFIVLAIGATVRALS